MIGFREEISFQLPFNFISYFSHSIFQHSKFRISHIETHALRVAINLRERRNIIKTPSIRSGCTLLKFNTVDELIIVHFVPLSYTLNIILSIEKFHVLCHAISDVTIIIIININFRLLLILFQTNLTLFIRNRLKNILKYSRNMRLVLLNPISFALRAFYENI